MVASSTTTNGDPLEHHHPFARRDPVPGPTTSIRPTRTWASRFVTWASRPCAAPSASSRARSTPRARPRSSRAPSRSPASTRTIRSATAHLTSPEFFDAESHPEITFSSAAGEQVGRQPDPLDRRDHDQGHHPADRADRHRRGERHRPVGQRAHRPRGGGGDRPARVRPQVEPDPPERQPARLQRRQAAVERSAVKAVKEA